MTLIVDIILNFLGLYLVFGVIFSVYFYVKGGVKLDEGMIGTPWHFKLIIFPGLVLFWSVLFLRLMKKDRE